MSVVGFDIPWRKVRHALGMPLVKVGGQVGCYVRIVPTKVHSGTGAHRRQLILTPTEARELAYHIRAVADLVDEGRLPGTMR